MARFTAEHYAALKDAYATGALSCSYTSGGVVRFVQYRSLADMAALLNEMERDLGLVTGAAAKRTSLAAHARGT